MYINGTRIAANIRQMSLPVYKWQCIEVNCPTLPYFTLHVISIRRFLEAPLVKQIISFESHTLLSY